MKHVTRLTFAALIAVVSLPALAANGSMSFWDQLWYAMTGQAPATAHADDAAGGCDNPRECATPVKK